MIHPRWLCAVLIGVLVTSGVAGSIAGAQTAGQVEAPPPPPAPPKVETQTPPPAETQTPAAVETPMSLQPEMLQGDVRQPSTGAKIGAGVLNVVYVPGKAILCGVGTMVAGVLMLATFGSAFREATSFFNEGCTGPWLVTPEQVSAVPKTVEFEY